MIDQRNVSFAFSLRKKPLYQLNARLWDLQKQDSNAGSYISLPSLCRDYAIQNRNSNSSSSSTDDDDDDNNNNHL